jgi:hypothetical protein
MLERAQPRRRTTTASPLERRRASRRASYHRRQAQGFVARLDVDAALLDLLVATRWLREDETADPAAVGAAIRALLEDLKKNLDMSNRLRSS